MFARVWEVCRAGFHHHGVHLGKVTFHEFGVGLVIHHARAAGVAGGGVLGLGEGGELLASKVAELFGTESGEFVPTKSGELLAAKSDGLLAIKSGELAFE